MMPVILLRLAVGVDIVGVVCLDTPAALFDDNGGTSTRTELPLRPHGELLSPACMGGEKNGRHFALVFFWVSLRLDKKKCLTVVLFRGPNVRFLPWYLALLGGFPNCTAYTFGVRFFQVLDTLT